MRKPLFTISGLPFWIIKQQIAFCQTRFLDLIILMFFDVFKKLSILEPPSKSSGRQNGTQNRQLSPNCKKVAAGERFLSRPAFPETIVITVPFGPSGF